jgi:Lrp/AsnC family leucine-responsive transcriptional regulator
MMDIIDKKILSIIQKDAKVSNSFIAGELGMTASAVFERIKKLKEKGLIKDYVVRLDPRQVDFGLMAFVSIKTNEKRERWDVGKIIANIPEVLEVHDTAGEECYLVKIRTKDTDTLYDLLRDKFGKIPAIASTKTTIVLRTAKETTILPLLQSKE